MLTDISALLGITPVDLITFGAIALVAVTLVLSFALAVRPKKFKPLSTRQYNAELFKRRMELEELSYPLLNDITIAGGKAGITRIDHVMRLPASLLLIVSAPSDIVGTPRCNPNLGEWRYHRADQSVGRFVNPVVQLHPLITAIRSRFPLVRVRLLCVFPRTTEFAGRPPRGCCLPEDVIRAIRDMAAEDGAPNQAMEPAWESISQALKQGTADNQAAGKAKRTG